MDVGSESSLQAWYSNVDNRLIQDAHKNTQDDNHCQYPLVIQSSAACSRLWINVLVSLAFWLYCPLTPTKVCY